jgi:hypothetical protein
MKACLSLAWACHPPTRIMTQKEALRGQLLAIFVNVTLQHKTSRLGQILESKILVLCDSVLQELSTNIFNIIILSYVLTEIWPFECSDS